MFKKIRLIFNASYKVVAFYTDNCYKTSSKSYIIPTCSKTYFWSLGSTADETGGKGVFKFPAKLFPQTYSFATRI